MPQITSNGKRRFEGGWVLHGGVILWQIDTLGKSWGNNGLEIKIKIIVNIPIHHHHQDIV